jgi:hypothetical protein
VLDPAWTRDLKLRLADVEELAKSAWVLIDLASLPPLLKKARGAATEVRTHTSPDGIMSARVEYGDIATRGFAMQDVVPYTTVNGDGEFAMRVLHSNRTWRKYADATGFAALLTSETPWAQHHADVLTAARPVGQGELIATDLPWLVAGCYGPLLAPRVAEHLLRAHLGGPVADHVQYWNRWDEPDIIVRDIGDLSKRYAELRAVRWAKTDDGQSHLGITLPSKGPARRHTMFCTGRIDRLDVHDGMPPEPLVIFMKWLAREVRDDTAWARKHLADQIVTWQFDTAERPRYAANFDSAAAIADPAPHVVQLRLGGGEGGGDTIRFDTDEGLYGDHALDFQDDLTARLRREIERG